MKEKLQKLTCLALALLCLLNAPCAMAAAINTETITMSSSTWEAMYLMFIALAEGSDLKMTDGGAFNTVEYPDRDAAFRFEHAMDIADFMRVAYYDDGNDAFHSAILTINLDHGGAAEEMAWLAIYFTVLAGDTATTQEELAALMEALCPPFSKVFSGEERLQGAQAATLRGVGYAMEISDEERVIRLFTNVSLQDNSVQ